MFMYVPFRLIDEMKSPRYRCHQLNDGVHVVRQVYKKIGLSLRLVRCGSNKDRIVHYNVNIVTKI